MAVTTRQRVLLHFLSKSTQGLRRTTLMKWLFLYSQASVDPVSRYDFVPYKFGPYSFEAFRDIQHSMARFIEIGEDNIHVRTECEAEVLQQTLKLPRSEMHIAEGIWQQYHAWSLESLLDHVYRSFPFYAARSERIVSTHRLPLAVPAVYSVGYEGRSIDAFFTLLLASGVSGILDVRRNAYSHKYGFLAQTLTALSPKLDMAYSHIPELGIASELRKDLHEPDAHAQLFAQYEGDLEAKQAYIDLATEHIRCRPTALLCFEAEPQRCHRSRLANVISAQTGLPIHHL